MSIYRYSLDAAVPEDCRGGVFTLGNFDGVHRGHQALLAETVRQARDIGQPAVAVTFDPHPLQLLRPDAFQPLLTTVPDRAELLAYYEADRVVILETNRDLLSLEAADFFDRIICKAFDARALVEGYNFAFGRN